MAMQEEMLFDVVEKLHDRYYGKYRGVVTDVDADTFRIKATVEGLFPGGGKTGWCMPCVPYAGKNSGIVFLPEKDSGVWIEFEQGMISQPIWSGAYWIKGEEPKDAKPDVKAIITKAGHKILFDDGGTSITITDPNNNKITLDGSGITLERGSKIQISDSEVNVNDGALEVR
jgi:hypothetical protein